MKYVRFKTRKGLVRYGILEENEKIRALESTPYEDMALTDDYYDVGEVDLICPADYSKAICIGLNYRDHAEEFGLPIPESPVVFMKPSTCQVGQGENVIYPKMCSRLDYEAELAVVIGKKCHKVSQEEALDYVLGYTIANDITARDLQPKNGQWTIAKCFDTFLPLGPYISDEVNPSDLYIAS
ncbi:MAG: fumarylacetoacetate hydrolase family protein, partial [Spirochaetales bacterium]|nr:fumarylacetoacetate hydrolase family protein [Spirochaetales bacterium]